MTQTATMNFHQFNRHFKDTLCPNWRQLSLTDRRVRWNAEHDAAGTAGQLGANWLDWPQPAFINPPQKPSPKLRKWPLETLPQNTIELNQVFVRLVIYAAGDAHPYTFIAVDPELEGLPGYAKVVRGVDEDPQDTMRKVLSQMATLTGEREYELVTSEGWMDTHNDARSLAASLTSVLNVQQMHWHQLGQLANEIEARCSQFEKELETDVSMLIHENWKARRKMLQKLAAMRNEILDHATNRQSEHDRWHETYMPLIEEMRERLELSGGQADFGERYVKMAKNNFRKSRQAVIDSLTAIHNVEIEAMSK